jgi:hypothetical protein
MSNTRDKNSIENYNLEQNGMQKIRDNLLFINAQNGHAYNPAFPELYMNGKMPSDNLSCNSVDIESRLFGINTNNLVNPSGPFEAKLKSLSKISFFQRPYLEKSKKIYPDNSQRPFIV